MSYMAQRVRNFSTTIFAEMNDLSNRHSTVNLGSGFPDFPGPAFIKQAAVEAIQQDVNQYTSGRGRWPLRQAIAEKMADFYGLRVDPDCEITVTAGATEAIYATLLGLVDPGDEVILFEPCYTSYLPTVLMAGGIPRFYPLRPPTWSIDADQLAALFSDKTKLILINTPHNPTGKVYTDDELRLVAELCHKHDVIAVCDEVYEHIVFDGGSHVPLATYPGMSNRTVTISNLGKTYHMTGWKVGWAIGAPELTQALYRVRQFTTGSGVTPLQEAAVTALHASQNYYAELAAMYQSSRDFLADSLSQSGLRPIMPQGTYFLMVDIGDLGFADDVACCRHLAIEVGVTAIPSSAFYASPANGAGLIRFAFCKTRGTLEKAARRLAKLRV